MAGSPDGGAPSPTSVQQNSQGGPQQGQIGGFFNDIFKRLHHMVYGDEDQTQAALRGTGPSRADQINDLYDNWPKHFQQFYGYDPQTLGRKKNGSPEDLRPPMSPNPNYGSEYQKIFGSPAKDDYQARTMTNRFYNEMRMRPKPKDQTLQPSANVMGPGGQ